MLKLFSAMIAGGATGLIGTVATKLLGIFGRRQAHRQELELRRVELESARIEAAGAENVAAIHAESETAQREYEAIGASYRHAMSRWTEGQALSGAQVWILLMVDVVRGLLRPALTVGFTVLTGLIYFTVDSVTGIAEIDDLSSDLRRQVLVTVLFLTTQCVTWWFGGRQMDKPGNR